MCVCVCIGVPEGEAAVNWRVAVYWPGDQTFFNATITKYRPETKQHEVRAVIHTHTHTSALIDRHRNCAVMGLLSCVRATLPLTLAH